MDSPSHALQTQTNDAPPALSIVIPAFNEAGRIVSTLEEITSSAAVAGSRFEVLVVDDGSTDATVKRAAEFASALAASLAEDSSSATGQACAIHVIPGGRHRGKGHAVRRGVLAARGEVILICDADLSTPLDQIDRLRPWLDRGFDVVIGSRRMDDSVLDPPQPRHRRVMDTVFRIIRRRCLLPDIRDTQCGFKCFSRDAAQAIFARATLNGFVFDCEVLALARRLGYRIKEVGVLWKNDPDSRVRPIRDAIAMLLGLWRIRRMMRTARLDSDRESDGPDRPAEAQDRRTSDQRTES